MNAWLMAATWQWPVWLLASWFAASVIVSLPAAALIHAGGVWRETDECVTSDSRTQLGSQAEIHHRSRSTAFRDGCDDSYCRYQAGREQVDGDVNQPRRLIGIRSIK